jgi:hypothetical protein
MRTRHPSNTTGTRRNGDLWIVIALATLLGLPVMLLTFAIGVGDTSVGNSSGPWVAGYVIGLGIPLAIGVGSYVAVRRRGGSRAQAIFTAAVAAPAMFVLPAVILIPIILLS